MRRQAQPSKALSSRAIGSGAVFVAAMMFAGAQPAQAQAAHAMQIAGTVLDARPAVARRVVISIPDRKLALIEDGAVVKVYPVAVGTRATPSPAGDFQVINRVTDPTWYGHESGVPVPPGPENPLGTRWIGLSKKGYGIHGTNAPKSIGKRASHGCIRMAQADLEELFEILRVGDAVVLEAQRTAEVAAIFGGSAAPAAAAGKVVVASNRAARDVVATVGN